MAKNENLTDEQWAILNPLIAEPIRRDDGRGRRWRENREVLDGILWILRTGGRWQDLLARFPPYQTCHRRFQMWVKDGTLKSVLETIAEDLRTRGELDLSECFIDGTFVTAKKGGLPSWKNQAGQRHEDHGSGRPLWFSCRHLHGFCFAAMRVKLVGETLAEIFTGELPGKLIGVKAYDSDPLDAELIEKGVEMIAPHKRNRKKAKTQDGRKLRRYKRRWKVERLFAWLHKFRRVVVRYDITPRIFSDLFT